MLSYHLPLNTVGKSAGVHVSLWLPAVNTSGFYVLSNQETFFTYLFSTLCLFSSGNSKGLVQKERQLRSFISTNMNRSIMTPFSEPLSM